MRPELRIIAVILCWSVEFHTRKCVKLQTHHAHVPRPMRCVMGIIFYNFTIPRYAVVVWIPLWTTSCFLVIRSGATGLQWNSNLTQSFLFVAVIYISRDGITKGAGLWLKEYILISQICLSFTGAAKRLETFYCNFLLHHCFSFLVIMIHCFLSRKRLLRVHFSHLVDHSTVLITIPTFWGTDFFFFLKVTLNIYI